MRSQDGMILVMVLVMMLMGSLLLMVQLRDYLTYRQLLTHWSAQQKAFIQLERMTQRIANTLRADCIKPRDTLVNALSTQPHSLACTQGIGKHRYDYEAVDLGQFPCLASHHWLLTVKQFRTGKILQVRFAHPDTQGSCQNLRLQRMLNKSILSWRMWIQP